MSNVLGSYYVEHLDARWSDSDVLKGSIPSDVFDFFRMINICSVDVIGFGNELHIPDIDSIEQLQWGYSFNPKLKEMIFGWPKNWYVVATKGADPFIYDQESKRVGFCLHGQGSWQLTSSVASLGHLFWAIAVTSSIIDREDYSSWDVPTEAMIVEAKAKLIELFLENEVEECLKILSWT